MKFIKIAGLSLTAAATFAIGASPALAHWHHGHSHKVCQTEWHHHHRATVCHWVR
ncbi:MAG TPA: hypothetical protein VF503_23960 [Sphingobium sp.]|uniref:hypothetical protein n=1 Tax=Sphingobium sp. TaxID=1912891 RepID=UPI002ED2126B